MDNCCLLLRYHLDPRRFVRLAENTAQVHSPKKSRVSENAGFDKTSERNQKMSPHGEGWYCSPDSQCNNWTLCDPLQQLILLIKPLPFSRFLATLLPRGYLFTTRSYPQLSIGSPSGSYP